MRDALGAFPGRRVFVTGHTGFKGSWLSLWLRRLGAEVHGYALAPPTTPSLFEVAHVGDMLASEVRGDVRDAERLATALAEARPELVFHLAAQPLVRDSYGDPVGTFATNVMGTANVLEAVRHVPSVLGVVVVTTDKVYENRESMHAYQESDPLGGRDPYSASKAATEIVAASYRASFYEGAKAHGARIASARAGNVIGGGDWAADRLVPDALRAFSTASPLLLRFPDSVRPWQHVLEPLSAYVMLAHRLFESDGQRFASSWNFGPSDGDDATVGDVARAMAKLWGENARVVCDASGDHPHEAGLLRLDSRRAHSELGWRPRWPLQKALAQTVAWHRAWQSGADMRGVCLEQIATYEEDAS